MKKRLSFLSLFILVIVSCYSAEWKTIGCSAGNISASIPAAEKTTITHLNVMGTIDARDFKYIRDELTVLTYVDLSNATISAYTGLGGTQTASTTYAANAIPINAFNQKNTFTNIILPSNITAIGVSPFNGCTALTEIKIPGNVTTIDQNCFSYCNSLTSIVIPASVTNLGGNCFKNCTNLNSVSILSNLTSIPNNAFEFCNNLKSINIPATVTSLGYNTFQSSGIKSIALPSGVAIYYEIFKGCTSLNTLYINRATAPGYTSNTFTSVNKSELTVYVPFGSLSSYMSDMVWNTGFKAIIEGVKTVTTTSANTLSSFFTTIEKEEVRYLHISGTLDARDFKFIRNNLPKLESIDLTNVNIVAYSGAEGPVNGTTNYIYNANTLPDYSFENKTTIKNIQLPSGISKIGSNAFNGATALNSINILPGIPIIEQEVFSNCTALNSVYIPETVTTCEEAFNGSPSQAVVSISNPNYSSEAGCLYNKAKTTLYACPTSKTGSFSLPLTVTSLGNFALNNCSGLTAITLPASLTSIGEAGFVGCSALTTITCNALTPPAFDTDFCEGLTKSNITLYVPASSYSTYKNTDGWKDFKIASSGFTLTPADATIGSKIGETASFTIVSDANWIVSTTSSFISISKTNGSKIESITVTTTGANVLSGVRYGYVSVKQLSNNQTLNFVITQSGITTDINESEASQVEVFPNPVSDEFKISGLTEPANIQIFSTNGILLMERKVSDNESISITDLKTGEYFLKIKTNNSLLDKILIKK